MGVEYGTTPNASIDYVNETLTSLTASANYTVNGTSGWTAYSAPVAADSYYVRVKAVAGSSFAGTVSGGVTVTAAVSGYVLADRANPDIKAKFGVSTASDAFACLHLLISTPQGTDDFTTIIALGNYVNLPSLTIGGAAAIADKDLGTPGDAVGRDRLIVSKYNGGYDNGYALAPHRMGDKQRSRSFIPGV